MRKLPVFLLALLVALTAVGCDSDEDDTSDAELFVGTWTLVSLSDAQGDKTAAFGQIANGLTADLNSDNSFLISVDYKEDSGIEDLTIPGTYEVEAGSKTFVITPPTGQNVPFSYDIENESRIALSAAADFVNALFNTTTYQGTVQIVIQKTS